MIKVLFSTLILLSSFAPTTKSFAADDGMSELARPRPRLATYRCCAKPATTYGRMNCMNSVDKLLAWGTVIYRCEYIYGKGTCVSQCRRL